ncbi:antiterminator Q family protein [Rodentibacter pneumotropicus]|uniref:antiterminator Q family protein n=1 Tax=Rodentibacter pneumotropicus TaxID=758 RepID=UPI000986B169|nr:antiterminator Q family protein [Rodentibacter pneumotropicus]OOF62057.1 antitermination protein [Rodentibacter pneumotropicus]THA18296.1 antitermination protein [Rodentibacter pneumotropicus]
MVEKLQEEPRQEWVENHLNHWGAWVFSGLDFDCRMNMIAKLMQQVDTSRICMPVREMCDDELGLVISTVVGYYIKKPCPQDYKYLEAKYVYGLSVYAIAKFHWQKNKTKSLRTWQRKVAESIKASEWIIAKFLDLALKNHQNADKLKKFAFNV